MAFGLIAETQKPVEEMANTTEDKTKQLEEERLEQSIKKVTEEINKALKALHDELIK